MGSPQVAGREFMVTTEQLSLANAGAATQLLGRAQPPTYAPLRPPSRAQETGETSPGHLLPQAPPKRQRHSGGPVEAARASSELVVLPSPPVISLPPLPEPLDAATLRDGLGVADELVLMHVEAVLRRHPSFAQQITRAYGAGASAAAAATPSPRRSDGQSNWFTDPTARRRHTTSASPRLLGLQMGRSTSEITGEPSQRGWKRIWRRSFYVMTTTALLAISGQVYQERSQRLEYEQQREVRSSRDIHMCLCSLPGAQPAAQSTSSSARCGYI